MRYISYMILVDNAGDSSEIDKTKLPYYDYNT